MPCQRPFAGIPTPPNSRVAATRIRRQRVGGRRQDSQHPEHGHDRQQSQHLSRPTQSTPTALRQLRVQNLASSGKGFGACAGWFFGCASLR
eukprot:1450675-Rhodomonas_salina.1